MLDHVHLTVIALKKNLQEFLDNQRSKENAEVNAFEETTKRIDAVNDRLTGVAKRVNLLENPKLKNVRSMPRPGEE
jgi:hypothetical protein